MDKRRWLLLKQDNCLYIRIAEIQIDFVYIHYVAIALRIIELK